MCLKSRGQRKKWDNLKWYLDTSLWFYKWRRQRVERHIIWQRELPWTSGQNHVWSILTKFGSKVRRPHRFQVGSLGNMVRQEAELSVTKNYSYFRWKRIKRKEMWRGVDHASCTRVTVLHAKFLSNNWPVRGDLKIQLWYLHVKTYLKVILEF